MGLTVMQEGPDSCMAPPEPQDKCFVAAKACDKIARAQANGRTFYSLEFFPPHTVDGARNLVARIDRLAALQPKPEWVDVTWTIESGKRAMETLVAAKAVCTLDVQMHLTCTGLSKDSAADVLAEAMDAGIRSVLVLRGDPQPSEKEWKATADGFANATELVAFIREKHGDYFSIAVAGHPNGHPSSDSRDTELKHLKAKVDAGADYIITQIFFEAAVYQTYVADCRKAGIQCPIVPGILMIPPSIEQLQAISSHCSVSLPSTLTDRLEKVRSDAEAVRLEGLKHQEELVQQLIKMGAPGFYVYTMNLEKSVTELVTNLNLAPVQEGSPRFSGCRDLPWPKAREEETVRPIFWASNPISYLSRTSDWKEFPDAWRQVSNVKEMQKCARPELQEILYSHHSLVGRRLGSKAERRNMWGQSPVTEEDVYDVFSRFLQGRIPKLPWCDKIEPETLGSGILNPLSVLNHFGFLSINSQPRVNGAKSDDPSFGWGPPGGFVYQKAYLEFFCNPENFEKLIKGLDGFKSISLEAFKADGSHRAIPCRLAPPEEGSEGRRQVTAVTWGVFDGMEILQPTVVDSHSFEVWKDEAFEMWKTAWATIYADSTPSKELLDRVHDTYWHVYIVDNDFINGNIYKVFSEILRQDVYAGIPAAA